MLNLLRRWSHCSGQYDVVKVLDFGLVKSLKDDEREATLTAAGSLFGTPLYLSPEAIERPETVDARGDIYAIGAVGYYLLTGTALFRGSTTMDICLQHLQAQPEPPSLRLGRPISAKLEALILKCLAKKAQDRPQCAVELAEELARCESDDWSRETAIAWWMNVNNQRVQSAAAQRVTADPSEETALLPSTPVI